MSLSNVADSTYDLIVIGGGPAGFMGAITAAENGVQSILLLESNNNLP